MAPGPASSTFLADPQFEWDLFISYAHANNQSGWVTQFVRDLDSELREALGGPRSLAIKFDTAQRSNADFERDLLPAVAKSGAFLFILSEAYVSEEHPWCRREWELFHDSQAGRLYVDQYTRIFKVLYRPVQLDQHPFLHMNLNGVRMFDDPAPGERIPNYYVQNKPNDPDQRYWKQIRLLAADIAALLLGMKTRPAPTDQRPMVFLAPVAPSLEARRAEVKAFLIQQKVRVLPELPASPDELPDILRSSVCSLHLFNGDEHAPAEEVLRIAQNATTNRRPQVWLDPAVDLRSPVHASLTKLLQPDSGAPELVKGGLEEFKLIAERLVFPERAKQQPAFRLATRPMVYVACDTTDLDRAQQLSATLAPHADVSWSQADEPLSDFRKYLKSFQGVLLIYASSQTAWVRERLLAATKAATTRRKAKLAIGVYIGPPPGKPPLNVSFSFLKEIRAEQMLDEAALQLFLAECAGESLR